MILEHFSKINISLGALVIICFFLPWLSVDCGNVTIAELSGYDLATGHIVLEQSAMQQLTQRGQDFSALQREHQARPQLYLVVVVFCALGMVGYGIRMLQELNRVGMFAVGVFGVFGILLMAFAAGRDFGIDIPADAARLVQISHPLAFYVTMISFLGTVVLSVLGICGSTEASEESVTIELPIAADEKLSNTIEELPIEEESNSFSTVNDFGEPPELVSTEIKRIPAPAGSKICTSCGAVVSAYQTKCLKCGMNVKPGK